MPTVVQTTGPVTGLLTGPTNGLRYEWSPAKILIREPRRAIQLPVHYQRYTAGASYSISGISRAACRRILPVDRRSRALYRQP